MEHTEIITLAGGCFWCTEAVFRRLNGVISVQPGYAGGDLQNPTYEDIGTGKTGHAEAIQVEFDPTIITLDQILEVFWATHDPTTLNRQGADVGTQYRSAIFYHSSEQRKIAEKSLNAEDDSNHYSDPIVTEITPFTNFFPAEEYHKEFYERNRNSGYCKLVIDPKIQKLYTKFPGKVL